MISVEKAFPSPKSMAFMFLLSKENWFILSKQKKKKKKKEKEKTYKRKNLRYMLFFCFTLAFNSFQICGI